VCHFVGSEYRCPDFYNPVDGDEVPVSHFGVVLDENEFNDLVKRFESHNINFIIPPHRRFVGAPGEQLTM
jgi:uncharacterized protein